MVKNLARVVKAAITLWKETTVSFTLRYKKRTEVPGKLKTKTFKKTLKTYKQFDKSSHTFSTHAEVCNFCDVLDCKMSQRLANLYFNLYFHSVSSLLIGWHFVRVISLT